MIAVGEGRRVILREVKMDRKKRLSMPQVKKMSVSQFRRSIKKKWIMEVFEIRFERKEIAVKTRSSVEASEKEKVNLEF